MKIWRFIAAIAFAICGTTAFAATTSVQFGADRTVAPWNICVYDSTNTCRTFMTLPSTGGGALIPPAYGGTGVNNGTNTLTLGGVLATTGTGATTLAFPNSAATFTYPLASDTLVGLAATQILSNKSFASSFNVNGATSGSVNIAAQAVAGTVSLTLPSASGTVAASAASPILLSSTTGQISCPSCLTGAGGALTATAPLNLSGSNVLSLQGGNGTIAQGSAGTGSSFTATPTLGVAGSTLGSVAFANTTSGTVTLQPTSGALGSSVLSLPAITDTLVTLTATQTLSNKTLASPAHTGTSTFAGSSTGTVSLAAQASAGTPSILFPTGSGTLADSAASPITLSSTTGQIGCATCVTSSGGGPISGTSPINVSAAGVVSLQGASGTLAQGSGGTGSTMTPTPTLGVAGSTLGTLTFANLTSGGITLSPPTGALGSSVLTLPATTDTVAAIAAAQTFTNKTITSSTDVLGGVTMTLGSDAAGDLYYRNSGGLLTRLGVGSTGSVLTVSGGLPSWQPGGTASSIAVGTTSVTSGTTGYLLYNNAGALGNETIGGILTAGSGISITGTTNATIALSLSNASLEGSPTNPIGTNSATAVMMGMGSTCHLTPSYSGRMRVTFDGSYTGTGTNNMNFTVRYGTGTAPANAAAATGTSVGPVISTSLIAAQEGFTYPFSMTRVITGLTPGTAVWLDMSISTNGTGTTATISSMNCAAEEF